MVCRRSCFPCPPSVVGGPSTAGVGYVLPLGTPAQRLHKVYDLGRFSITRGFDLFASVLFTQQFCADLVLMICAARSSMSLVTRSRGMSSKYFRSSRTS